MRVFSSYIFVLIILEILFLNVFFLFGIYQDSYKDLSLFFKFHYKSVLFFNFCYLLISYLTKSYTFKRHKTVIEVVYNSITCFLIFSLLLFAVAGLRANRIMSNITLTGICIALFFINTFIRVLYLYILRILYKHNKIKKDIMVFGNSSTTKSFIKSIQEKNHYGLNLIAHYIHLDKQTVQSVIDNYTFDKKVDIYLEIPSSINDTEFSSTLSYIEDKRLKVFLIPQTKSFLSTDIKPLYINSHRILQYKNFPFESKIVNLIKRIFDVSFSLVFLSLVLSWLVPVIALLIKITSKGSVFYLQERIGIEGKPFKIIKFRSMFTDAENLGPQLSTDNDPRITPIGKILRKYRIDEFPQFFNVLKGEMSIVGPRPEREYFIEQISKISPRYRRLHHVKPGITSLGQVYYGYAETVEEMVERLKYDLLYLNNYNLLMDIKIIFLTFIVIFKGKGK